MMPKSSSSASESTRNRKRFGNILRKIRKVRGLSIYTLASEADVDAGYISRLENGHRNPPSPKILARFAEALTIPVNILYMAAGYLEMDPSGRHLDEADILSRVEAELTSGRRQTFEAHIPSGTTVKSPHEIEELISQLDEVKKKLSSALVGGGPMLELPILGRIPAGFPIGVEEYTVGKLAVEKTGMPNDPDLFVLRVHGDSLRDKGIVEGDYVVISPLLKNAYEQGSIFAVRLENDDVTLKRVYFSNTGVILRSANPDYPDIEVPTVTIIGKLVRLVRQY